MTAYIILLILFLPLTFLAATVESLFSSDDLTEMGIRIEDPRASVSS